MYLLIAYKPSSEDYCRGCCMEHYSSDFIIQDNLSYKEVIEKYSDILVINTKMDCNEIGYRIFIYRDGIQLIYHSSTYVNYWDDNLTDEENQQRIKELKLKASDIIDKSESKFKEKLEDIKKKEQEKLLKEKQEKELREKEQRLKQYNILKKEFSSE